MAEDLYGIQQYNNRKEGDKQKKMYNYYTGDDVPVDDRQPVSEAKAASHTNLHIDFFKDIIELKVGYMGQKITPVINIEEGPVRERVEAELKMFNRYNSSHTLNSESVRMASISGKSHRLCYTEDGVFKIKNIPAWSVVYDYKETPLNPDKAYYYYSTIDLTGNTTNHCDVYDKTEVTYYEASDNFTSAENSNKPKGSYLATTYVRVDSQPHNFKEVPIIPIMNSDMETGDCDESIDIMNVYDEVISDTSAEVKAMRLAYLVMYGDLYTGTDSEGNEIDINTWMKQTSTMRFPSSEDGKQVGGAEFLEKNINDTVIENILNRLRTHIYEVSGSLDLKELANTERVFSIKAQMMRLENTSKVSESYMRSALYKQTRLWTYWMREFNNIPVIETDLDWEFQRVFPRDLAAEAGTIAQLANTITLEDALTAVGWESAKEIADRAGEANSTMIDIESEIITDEE